MVKCLWLLLLLALLPARAEDALTAGQIVQRVVARDKVLVERRRSFDYDMKITREKLDDDKKTVSKEGETVTVTGDKRPNYGTRDTPADPEQEAKKTSREEPFELLKIIDHYTYTLEGRETVDGVECYRIAFAPKPGLPYRNREEKVLNHVSGHIWASTADFSVICNEGSLTEPVSVAWIFATLREMEFHFDAMRMPNGDYGPGHLQYRYLVSIPFMHLHERDNPPGLELPAGEVAAAACVKAGPVLLIERIFRRINGIISKEIPLIGSSNSVNSVKNSLYSLRSFAANPLDFTATFLYLEPSHESVRAADHLLRADLARVLRGQDRVVLQAPTGSGKSTQVPQYLLDDGLAGTGRIVVLQPRRLAARLLAKRVAEERQAKLGGEVGFQYRLENVSSRDTRILYVTEGILLRQMQDNPKLPGISVLVFDEFHERHLEGDVALARARQIQQTARPDLKIIVMSATLETALLTEYLKPVEVLESPGKMFPVTVEYLPKPDESPAWELAAGACDRVLHSGKCPEGDILIFMPGAYEIMRTLNAVRDRLSGRDFAFHALHGELPPAEQDAAVGPSEKRKVIVSTNVAETSLTIDGVRVVIDSGLARVARFDPHRGINTLLIEKISRASAQQRLGRAGRTAPGPRRAALDRARARAASRADHAGNPPPRAQRRAAHAQGQRHRRSRRVPVGRGAGTEIVRARHDAAARPRRTRPRP